MKLHQLPHDRNIHPSLDWLGLLTIVLSTCLFPTMAQSANAAPLCQGSQLNTDCKTAQIVQQTPNTEPNSAQTSAATQTIKFKLNDLSGVSEWIRVDVSDRQVKLLHTVVSASGVAKAVSSATRLPAFAHTWYDHPTTRIFFQPEGCTQTECLITGTDTVTLPDGISVYQGQFTLEYTESGWQRTITFKVPQDKG
jgi:hypothetical protein